MSQSIKKAVLYIDDRLSDHYDELLKIAKRSKEGEKAFLEKDNLDQMAIHYLYTRSFYPEIEIKNNKLIVREQESAHILSRQNIHVIDKDYLLSDDYQQFVDTICQS